MCVFLEPLIQVNKFLYLQNLKLMLYLYRWGFKSLSLHVNNFEGDKELIAKLIAQRYQAETKKPDDYKVKIIE